MLGSVLQSQNKLAEAEAQFRQALKIDPSNVETLNFLGYNLAEQNKNLDEALQLTGQAVDAQPNNPHFLDSLGWVHFKMGKLDDAQSEILKATQSPTPSAVILEHLGDVYNARCAKDLAVQAWQKALSSTKDPAQTNRIRTKMGSDSKK
jgi:tetratricopeptide (TPR) repeat protein